MEKLVTLMFIYICVIQDVVSRAQCNNSSERSSGKIFSGFKASKQFPYQVYLLIFARPEDYQCGGSIISTRHVLTSALCLQGATTITARLGSTAYTNSAEIQYTSRDFKSHPLYNQITTDYNVGFVRFRKLNIDGIYTKVISLAPKRSFVEPETILTVSSWGTTTENDNIGENSKAIDVRVLSNMECQQFYIITSRMFCAVDPEPNKDSNKSYSGVAAVSSDGVQRGLVSYPITDLRPGIPGIYTRIGNQMIRSWIKINTGV